MELEKIHVYIFTYTCMYMLEIYISKNWLTLKIWVSCTWVNVEGLGVQIMPRLLVKTMDQVKYTGQPLSRTLRLVL